MNIRWLFVYLITLACCFAQADKSQPVPEARIVRLTLDTKIVTVLHLRPGYVSCVRLPEDVSAVVLGNPSTFKAEHSDVEPRLVSLKPTTPNRAETNALITTKTGREVALHLVSSGSTGHADPVDFVLEYDHPQSLVIAPSHSSFIVSRIESLVPEPLPSSAKEKPAVTNNLDLQSHEQKPHWQGKELRVAVGAITETDQQMAVAFSVLNASTRTIELLPPQIQLAGTSRKRHGRPVKAEPIAIKEYTITGRRLLPGASANAVVLFERPSFKESAEQLLLRIAQAEEVDRPVVVPIAFVAPVEGGEK
jgi:hypothetical protein